MLRFARVRLFTSGYAVSPGPRCSPFNCRTVHVIMSQPDIESAIERVKAGAVDQYRTVIAAFHQPLRAALTGLCGRLLICAVRCFTPWRRLYSRFSLEVIPLRPATLW